MREWRRILCLHHLSPHDLSVEGLNRPAFHGPGDGELISKSWSSTIYFMSSLLGSSFLGVEALTSADAGVCSFSGFTCSLARS